MKKETADERFRELRAYAIFSIMGLLLLGVTGYVTWKRLGVVVLVLSILVYLILLLNKKAAKIVADRNEFINYANDKQDYIKVALDGLNDLMVRQEKNLSVSPDIWYDLNESIIHYVANYLNNRNEDMWDKSDPVIMFIQEMAQQLDLIIKSKNQKDMILELTNKLNTNKPIYGINPYRTQ